jgi:hypothetical protein
VAVLSGRIISEMPEGLSHWLTLDAALALYRRRNKECIRAFKPGDRARVMTGGSKYWTQIGIVDSVERWGYSGMLVFEGALKPVHFYFRELEKV